MLFSNVGFEIGGHDAFGGTSDDANPLQDIDLAEKLPCNQNLGS
jgi:hypothetical protein